MHAESCTLQVDSHIEHPPGRGGSLGPEELTGLISVKMAPIQTPDDVTREWLTFTLSGSAKAAKERQPASLPFEVASFDLQRIGTGQVSEAYLVTVRNEQGSQTAVLKLASSNPTSRASAKQLGLYEREVLFYQHVAPLLPDVVPRCYHSSRDEASNSFALLLENAGPTIPGLDDLTCASLEQAELALATLGRLHHALLKVKDDEALAWLHREPALNQAILSQLFSGYRSRYRERLDPRHLEVCSRFVASFAASTKAQNAAEFLRSPIHGDYRLDNLLFGKAGTSAPRSLSVVDWQTITYGGVMGEVAYFLGCSVPLEIRRTHLDELLATYLHHLDEPTMTLERARIELAAQAFFGIVMGIASPMMVVQTKRGDDMFMAMMARHCELVLDLGSLEMLPPHGGIDAPLVPSAEDERLHKPGPEELWNESLYFDFVDPASGVSGWSRLGLTPNLAANNWILMLCLGGEKRIIGLHDDHAPAPEGDGSSIVVKTDTYKAAHTISAPLRQLHVSIEAQANVFESETAALRTDATTHASRPTVPVSLDLTWNTVGMPYQYQITTRYEVPCQVSGTITVDDAKFQLDGAAGQRDHSHGVRDWWSMNWMWSAIHLDDGTHIHGLDLRIPGRPAMGMGYIQKDLSSRELKRVNADWTYGEGERTSLVETTQMVIAEGETPLRLSLSPGCHAPVRLVAPDGRVSLFDRAWCRAKDDSGRSGVAWCEWNSSVEWTP